MVALPTQVYAFIAKLVLNPLKVTMRTFLQCLVMLVAFTVCTYSQTTITGRFVGMKGANIDSAQVSLCDGTMDTTFCSFPISSDGSFAIVTQRVGTLMARFSCPGYRPLKVALLFDRSTTDTVDVTLSPASKPYGEGNIVFHRPMSTLARFALLHRKSSEMFERIEEEKANRLAGIKSDQESDSYWYAETGRVESALKSETEPLLRQELIMQYLELDGLRPQNTSKDSIKKWVPEIPPESPAWVYHFNLCVIAGLFSYHPDSLQYVGEIITLTPDRWFRAMLLYERAHWARVYEDERKVEVCLAELINRYPDTKYARMAQVTETIKVGNAVPSFSVRSADDSLTYYTSKNMLGKMYLIDFWRTTCESCVDEMKYLHNAYKRFSKLGVTFLSISTLDTKEELAKFRKDQWSMPWLHALEVEQPDRSISTDFGQWGVPFSVLVDTSGTIVASGWDLLGNRLEGTIEKFVGKK